MKTAVVIGAVSGIGKGLVTAFKEKNIRVIQADINIPLDEQTDECRHIDATDVTTINSFITYFNAHYTTIDYLVITIGVIDEGSAPNYSAESLSWIMEVNLFGPYRLVQSLLPFLSKSDEPRILLTGSTAGLGYFEDTANLLPYIVSKHALMGYFKVLRKELEMVGTQVSILIPNRIKGNLSENSAKLRTDFLGETFNSSKGRQPLSAVLTDPAEVCRGFLKEFLSGKTYISNNEEMVLRKLKDELRDLTDGF